MSTLRWHSLLQQWVVVASHRQDRPQMPKDWCPFCPGSGRVPEQYDVLIYPNDFPGFSFDSPPYEPHEQLFAETGAQGAGDVVLYSPQHTLPPSQMPAEQWHKIVNLWTTRCHELASHEVVQYISVFENTGEAIGVTMPHPHGQIYAFPFIPPLVDTELNSASAHHQQSGQCLYCEILRGETDQKVRIVATNENFVAFVPFAARFPYEVNIYSKRHFPNLIDMTEEESRDLAAIISIVRRKYDHLFGFLLPLMMVVRQAPTKGEHPYFHFHLEFLPIQRSKTKLKYLAAVETACGTFLSDTRPEEKAAELRASEPATQN